MVNTRCTSGVSSALKLDRLQENALYGIRSMKTVIQPDHVNIFQETVSLNPEDFE